MHSGFIGEFFGTAVLILLGNGVVACVVLKDSYGHHGGWIVITAGWCFAVVVGVLTALSLGSNAHLNPAVTLGRMRLSLHCGTILFLVQIPGMGS